MISVLFKVRKAAARNSRACKWIPGNPGFRVDLVLILTRKITGEGVKADPKGKGHILYQVDLGVGVNIAVMGHEGCGC